MKKISSLRALLLAAALALPAAAKPVQIWVNSQAEADYYANMVKVYNQKVDKNFSAEFKAYGFMEMPDKLALAVKSGINTPDIVQFDEIFFSLYLRGEIPFVDLTDRIAKSPLRTGLLPTRTGLFKWKGRTYGVPQSTSNVVLWYRADLLKEEGLVPNDLRTWESFEAAARKVRAKGSRHMLAMDWSYLGMLVRQRGYDFYNAQGEPLVDSAIIVDTWKRLADWNQSGVGMMPGQGGIFSPQFFSTSVADNGVIAIMGADWYGLDILQNFDKDRAGKWRAMPLPVWTDSKSKSRRNTSSFSGQGLVIFKKSKQVEASWKFVEWVMTDIDANVERYLQGNCFTPFKPAWTDGRLARPEPFFGNQVLSQLFMEVAPKAPTPAQSPMNAMIVNFVREQYFSSVMGGGTTPEEAFSEMKQKIAAMSKGK
jgi:ABC-type glycerol-3-phosphate transport system substrate-binding protein